MAENSHHDRQQQRDAAALPSSSERTAPTMATKGSQRLRNEADEVRAVLGCVSQQLDKKNNAHWQLELAFWAGKANDLNTPAGKALRADYFSLCRHQCFLEQRLAQLEGATSSGAPCVSVGGSTTCMHACMHARGGLPGSHARREPPLVRLVAS
jgi:hypothetical protein